MMKRLSIIITILVFSVSYSHATILFQDDFNNSVDWDGRTDDVDDIDSEDTGNWETLWCPSQSDDSHAEIADAYGYSGKGLRFTLSEDGCGAPSTAQESCLFSNNSSMDESSLFFGFRFKYTGDWGTDDANKNLKLTRIYCGGVSYIPDLSSMGSLEQEIIMAGIYTGVSVPDTNWHTYIMEFTAGDGSTNGVWRIWVDGELEYEKTDMAYGGTTFSYAYFPILQGNLSGGYNGTGLYTYWDDYLWATTKTEVDNFLGGSEEDTTDPTVTAFVIPSTASSLTVAISTFTATDDTGVTGYCVNETETAPTSGSCSGSGWESSAQTSYMFSTEGAKTLYAWAKDEAGNISNSLDDSVTITLPSTYSGVSLGSGKLSLGNRAVTLE